MYLCPILLMLVTTPALHAVMLLVHMSPRAAQARPGQQDCMHTGTLLTSQTLPRA